MLSSYMKAALEQAHYEIIEDDEPFYERDSRLERCLGYWKHVRSVS